MELNYIYPLCGFHQIWQGMWQGNEIIAKILNLRECTIRNSRDFKEEYPRLRFVVEISVVQRMGLIC